MRLRHITFTGIDAKTDIMDLAEIQKQYPLGKDTYAVIQNIMLERMGFSD